MYFFFVTICYCHILSTATSYVLLAANIDDFRSIANKFPMKIAKDIMDIVHNPNGPKQHYESSREFYEERNREERLPREENHEERLLSEEERENHGHRVRADDHDTQSKYNLSLDELVEKVKERLQAELTIMAATANQQSRSDPIEAKMKQKKPKKNLQQRFKMESRHDDENRWTTKQDTVKNVEPRLLNNKYVADIFVAPPSKLKPKQPEDEYEFKPKEPSQKTADAIKKQEQKITEATTHMYAQQVNQKYIGPKHRLEQLKEQEPRVVYKRPQKHHKPKLTQEHKTQEYKNENSEYKKKHFEYKNENADELEQKSVEITAKQKRIFKMKHKKQASDRVTTDAIQDKKLLMATEGTETTNVPLFEGVDLNEKDGYEDYVMPKKDDDFDISEHRKGFDEKFARENNKRERPNSRERLDNKRESLQKREGFYNTKQEPNTEDTDTKSEPHNSEEKLFEEKHRVKKISRNINKKEFQAPMADNVDKTKRQEPEIANSADATIRPYAEQVLSRELYADETLPTVYEEPKARTKHISFKDDIAQVTKDAMTGKRKKSKPKLATVMLKRDFYKLSSPNYLAQMPIVAEKYKFDEPIPELDREPENLKPVGNPPASINGKIRLT